jgi:hypothetical protein
LFGLPFLSPFVVVDVLFCFTFYESILWASLTLGPLFWECPHPRALPYTKSIIYSPLFGILGTLKTVRGKCCTRCLSQNGKLCQFCRNKELKKGWLGKPWL